MTREQALAEITDVAALIRHHTDEREKLYRRRNRLYATARRYGATREDLKDAAGVSLAAVKATLAASPDVR